MYDDVGSSLTEMCPVPRRSFKLQLVVRRGGDGSLKDERQQKRCERLGLETEEGKREYLYLSTSVW